jgi:hypothetical protein
MKKFIVKMHGSEKYLKVEGLEAEVDDCGQLKIRNRDLKLIFSVSDKNWEYFSEESSIKESRIGSNPQWVTKWHDDKALHIKQKLEELKYFLADVERIEVIDMYHETKSNGDPIDSIIKLNIKEKVKSIPQPASLVD